MDGDQQLAVVPTSSSSNCSRTDASSASGVHYQQTDASSGFMSSGRTGEKVDQLADHLVVGMPLGGAQRKDGGKGGGKGGGQMANGYNMHSDYMADMMGGDMVSGYGPRKDERARERARNGVRGLRSGTYGFRGAMVHSPEIQRLQERINPLDFDTDPRCAISGAG